MEENNAAGDGESRNPSEPLSPKMGGKKFKLNDGTSQEALKEDEKSSKDIEPFIWSPPTMGLEELAPSSSTDENLDSGVSADQPESSSTDPTKPSPTSIWPNIDIWKAFEDMDSTPSTSKDENADSGMSADKSESSDDRSASTSAGPSNSMVNITASENNIRAILLNIRQSSHRNYRKRKTPDDADSNASSRDSDDFSAAEDTTPRRADENSDPDGDLHLLDLCSSTDTSDNENSMSTSSSSNSPSSPLTPTMEDYESFNESEGHVRMHSGETDTDEEHGWLPWSRQCESQRDKKVPEVLLKERPKHNYVILREIINREMGLSYPRGKEVQEDVMFPKRFYGSLHSVYRLKKLHSLNKHRGCVNSLNFHPEGQLLVSGSDDQNIMVWDWAKNACHQTIKTGHKSNIFQSKFLYLNAQSQLNIVTCARDGQVRLIQCPPGGGAGSRRRLASHARAAHKLHVSPHEPHSVLSAGEDGLCIHCDVRTDHANRLFQVKKNTQPIALYSIHGHPLDPHELIVAGRDQFIRMYDRRKCAKPVLMYAPTFPEKPTSRYRVEVSRRFPEKHLTSAIYNHDGSEILGSYNDDAIYLFDAEKDVYDVDAERDPTVDGYTARYTGHRNCATFKGVSFFGPKSEYVVSGSDCSYIYMWSKRGAAIVQWMQGDNGVVNCIETHPKSPVLATSGLDRDVKIWIPKGSMDPDYEGLERVVRENSTEKVRSPLFNDFLPTFYSAMRNESRTTAMGDDESPPNFGGNIEFEGNVCTTF